MPGQGRSNDGLYERGSYWYTKIKVDGAWVEKAMGLRARSGCLRRRELIDADAALMEGVLRHRNGGHGVRPSGIKRKVREGQQGRKNSHNGVPSTW